MRATWTMDAVKQGVDVVVVVVVSGVVAVTVAKDKASLVCVVLVVDVVVAVGLCTTDDDDDGGGMPVKADMKDENILLVLPVVPDAAGAGADACGGGAWEEDTGA
jgi:hypothetical protein